MTTDAKLSEFDRGYDLGYTHARDERRSGRENARTASMLSPEAREGYEAAFEAHFEYVMDI